MEVLKEKLIRIGELSRLTGISKKLIHYYISKGYLHPPVYKKGNQAFYDDSHLEKIKFLLDCKEKAIPLFWASLKWADKKTGPNLPLNKQQDPLTNDSKTKKHIMDEATKLFVYKGYYKTSINDVVDAVGITKPAFYYYFKNKKELYLSCMDKIHHIYLHEILGEIDNEEDPLKRIYMRGLSFTKYTREKIIALQVLKESILDDNSIFKEKAAELIQKNWIQPIKKDLECCMEKKIYRKVNSEIYSFFLISLLEAYTFRSIMEKRYSKETIRDCIREFIQYGLHLTPPTES